MAARRDRRARRAAARRRPELAASTRQALFIFASAADAGFSFRAAGAGKLEIQGPPGLADDLCEPVVAAVRAHGGEILRLVKWLDREADAGRFWAPRPEPGTRQ
jgi:hypothetical protein